MTVALADFEVDATLIAVTVTVVVVDTTGAVNKRSHASDGRRAGVNCCVPPEAVVTKVGETETEIR